VPVPASAINTELAVDGGSDALGHINLLLAHAIAADGLRQRPAGGEYFFKGRQ
jgi:hypothetical protein